MGAIVVGYDDSTGSKAALGVAAELASQSGDTLVIGYGYGPPGQRRRRVQGAPRRRSWSWAAE